MTDPAPTAESVLDEVMKVEPTIATMVGMFGGPAAAAAMAAIQPGIMMLVPILEKIIQAEMTGNGGDMVKAVATVGTRITAPYKPSLSFNIPTAADSDKASEVGSG